MSQRHVRGRRFTTPLSGFAGALLIAVSVAMTIQAAPPPADRPPETTARYVSAIGDDTPMRFEANLGQSDDRVKFLARGRGYSLFLTRTDASLVLRGTSSDPAPPTAVVRMRLMGANRHPSVTGLDPVAGTSNHFFGRDPAGWQRDVPNFAKVRYADVYPGIDQIFYGQQRQLEYDFVVAPGGDPRLITLAFDGVRAMSFDAGGNLRLQIAQGEIVQQRPVVYQVIGGHRQAVEGRYVLRGHRQVGFHLGAYDRRQPLVIDPVVSYASYLGGAGNDVGHAIAVDSAGNTYITGETLSVAFPGTGGSPIQPAKAASIDVFVTKISATGSAIVYSTYLGGSGADRGFAIAVDSAGNAYITGETNSPTAPGPLNVPFPTVGAVQPLHRGGGEAFVTKINAAGNALVYSTYLGGTGVERGYGIAVDTLGQAYVTGHTNSLAGLENFPSVAAFQPDNDGSYDAFVTKLNAAGNAYIYSTFLGGDDSEYSTHGGAIAVDAAGRAYVGGSTASFDFPGASTSGIQPMNGGGVNDGFVVRLTAGGGLSYSTYLGGTAYDEVNGLAIDSAGDAYVVGYTDSPNFPISAPLQPSRNGSGNDAFAARVNAAGTALVYSTYLGGSGSELAYDVAVDAASRAYFTGWTNSSNFPMAAPFQAINSGSGEAFVSALEATGSALTFSSYLGGSFGSEIGYGIAVDPAGNAYVTGTTNSSNFPTASPLQPNRSAGDDAFVVRIATAPTVLRPPTNLVATSITGNTVTISWTAPADSIAPTGYVLQGGITPGEVLASIPTNSAATTFTFTAPNGAYYIRMHSAAAGATSGASNEIRIFVNVAAPPSAPANLLGSANGSSLTLAWTNTAGGGTPTSLTLDVTGTLNATLGLPVTETFSVAGVPNGTYTMSLRAHNSAGASGPSNSLTLTFPGACAVPGTPTSFVATRSGSLITASWGLPASGPAPTSYAVNVTGTFNGGFTVQGLSIAGAVGSGSYTLSVAATNACGAGAATAAQTITVP